jgi:hypothetical protein
VRTFQDEFRQLLRRYEIDFDERYGKGSDPGIYTVVEILGSDPFMHHLLKNPNLLLVT